MATAGLARRFRYLAVSGLTLRKTERPSERNQTGLTWGRPSGPIVARCPRAVLSRMSRYRAGTAPLGMLDSRSCLAPSRAGTARARLPRRRPGANRLCLSVLFRCEWGEETLDCSREGEGRQ